MTEVTHSVSFTPNLTNKNSHVVVEFEDKPTKDKYVKAEARFTRKAYNDYLVASGAERAKARQLLEAKRQEFATSSGYAPKVPGGSVWTHRGIGDKPIRSA